MPSRYLMILLCMKFVFFSRVLANSNLAMSVCLVILEVACNVMYLVHAVMVD